MYAKCIPISHGKLNPRRRKLVGARRCMAPNGRNYYRSRKIYCLQKWIANAWVVNTQTDTNIMHMGRMFYLISVMPHTLIYIQQQTHYFAKRVCFIVPIIQRFRIVFCRLSSLLSSLPTPLQLLSLLHNRNLSNVYVFYFRKIVFSLLCWMHFVISFRFFCWFAL